MKKQQLPPLQGSFLRRSELGSGDLVIGTPKHLDESRFDFEVYLPSLGVNLQRGYVWSLEQQRALIESIFVNRLIPPLSLLLDWEDNYQVIDGKQRLRAVLDFRDGEFDFNGYLLSELPKNYITAFNYYPLMCYRLCEMEEGEVSDEEKIQWFEWINYAGTPQDLNHIQELKKKSKE